MNRIFALIFSILLLSVAEVLGQPPLSGAEHQVEKYLEHYLEPPVLGPGIDQRYRSAFVDLRDDGNLEVIVYLAERSWCGSGGCTLLILVPNASTFELVTKITVTRLPIRMLKTKTNGWHDLSVIVAGGGVSAHEVKLEFDGKTYPSNPSRPPAIELHDEAEGRVILSSMINGEARALVDDEAAIEQVLRVQQEAWNRHDLDAFMAGYWKSPELTFFSDAKENHGWQAALDRYRTVYASPGHEMGKLDFSELRIEMLGPNAAFVRGSWHLTLADGKTPHGIFTLVFRRFPDGWKIVHDHTSAAKE